MPPSVFGWISHMPHFHYSWGNKGSRAPAAIGKPRLLLSEHLNQGFEFKLGLFCLFLALTMLLTLAALANANTSSQEQTSELLSFFNNLTNNTFLCGGLSKMSTGETYYFLVGLHLIRLSLQQ